MTVKTKTTMLIAMFFYITPLISAVAETNALIEVKLFKNWVIEGERNFGNLAIKNTGTDPILLAKKPLLFEIGQLVVRPLPRDPVRDSEQEGEYQLMLLERGGLFELLPEETHVYEGRKLYLGGGLSFLKCDTFYGIHLPWQGFLVGFGAVHGQWRCS